MATNRANRDSTQARDAMIVQMRRNGSTYAEIAATFSLSEARVCQIVTAANRPITLSRPDVRTITAESVICALPGLGTRELKSLDRAGIRTVGQLAALNDNKLLTLPGFGRLSLAKVKLALSNILLPMLAIAMEICCMAATMVYADAVNLDWMM